MCVCADDCDRHEPQLCALRHRPAHHRQGGRSSEPESLAPPGSRGLIASNVRREAGYSCRLTGSPAQEVRLFITKVMKQARAHSRVLPVFTVVSTPLQTSDSSTTSATAVGRINGLQAFTSPRTRTVLPLSKRGMPARTCHKLCVHTKPPV